MKRFPIIVMAALTLSFAWADSLTVRSMKMLPGFVAMNRDGVYPSEITGVSEYTAGEAPGATLFYEMDPSVTYGNLMDCSGLEVSVKTDVGTFVDKQPGCGYSNSQELDDLQGTHLGHNTYWGDCAMEAIAFFPPGEYTVNFKGSAFSHPPLNYDLQHPAYVEGPVFGPFPFSNEMRFTVVPSSYDIAEALNVEAAVKKGLISIDTTSRGTSPHGWQPAFDRKTRRLSAANGLCGKGQSSTLTIKALRPVRLTGHSSVVSGDLTCRSTEHPQDRPLKADFTFDLQKKGDEVTFVFTRNDSDLHLTTVRIPADYLGPSTPVTVPIGERNRFPKAEISDCKVVELGSGSRDEDIAKRITGGVDAKPDESRQEETVATNIVQVVKEPVHKEQYSVRLSVEGGPNCTVSGQGMYAEGDLVRIQALAEDGWSFAGWYHEGNQVTISSRHRFLMPAKDISFVAKFTKYEPAEVKLFIEADDMPRTEVPAQATNLVLDVKSAICWRLVVESKVKTEVSINSLPRGLVYNRFNATIMGTPFHPGKHEISCWIKEMGQKGRVHLRAFTINALVEKPFSLTTLDPLPTGESEALTRRRRARQKAREKLEEKSEEESLSPAEPEEPKKFHLLTAANDYFETPLPNGPSDEPVRLIAGMDVTKTFPNLTLKKEFSTSCKVVLRGLPRGVKCDARQKRVVGAPTRVGDYLVTVTVTEKETKVVNVSSFVISVVLPDDAK